MYDDGIPAKINYVNGDNISGDAVQKAIQKYIKQAKKG